MSLKYHRETPKNKSESEGLFCIVAGLTSSQEDGHWSKGTALPNPGPCPPTLQHPHFFPGHTSCSLPTKRDSPFPPALSTEPFKPCQPVSSAGLPSSYPSQSTNGSSRQRRQRRILEGSEGTTAHRSTSCSEWVACMPPNKREHSIRETLT